MSFQLPTPKTVLIRRQTSLHEEHEIIRRAMMRVVRDICSSYDWIESFAVDGGIRTVLANNDRPKSPQTTSLASLKEYFDFEHRRITEDIETLQHALDFLHARRHSLQRLSVRHAGALSTFRRLPNEILSEIFLHVCGDEPIRVARLREGPWTLRAVCRKWAGIVEGCSRLWCDMVIDVAHEDVDPAAFAQAVGFCGSRPIQMTISVNKIYGQHRWDSFCGVLDIIVSSSTKWATLIIESSEDLLRCVLELFPRLEGRLPLLRCLKLVGAERWDMESLSSTPPMLQTLLTAPLLEDVYVEMPHSTRSLQLLNLLPLPCQQIRRLSCNAFEYEPTARQGPLYISKEKFPLLERCAFISYDAPAQSSNQVSASARLEHDGVTHLVTSRADVLNAFSFPALCTFTLGDLDEEPNGTFFTCESSEVLFKRAADMLSASRCSLVSLTLSYTLALVDEFLQILNIVPTLEVLDMRIAWSDGTARDEVLCSFFAALINRRTDSKFSLLPALQELQLSVAAYNWISHNHQDYYVEPYVRHDFRFVSQVFGAITERSTYPSDFRAFSFTMLTDDLSRWFLSEGDIGRLQDLKLTNFSLESQEQERAWDDDYY